jgi:hypothetical protein
MGMGGYKLIINEYYVINVTALMKSRKNIFFFVRLDIVYIVTQWRKSKEVEKLNAKTHFDYEIQVAKQQFIFS